MDIDQYLDSIQDQFDDNEEKAKSSSYPDLDRSPKKNWVENGGGLPKYIERIAKHLHYEKGMDIGRAIATAISTVKRWAAGGGNVKADTQAKAAAALAQWEKLKAKSNRKKDMMGTDMETQMHEYKNVSVKGLQVADPDTGVVEAIVSVTGIVDEVKDIIKPGAYAKTLAKRTPKGVYSHAWDQPISRTLDIKELMPGDERLPKQMADGTPWPREAGALYVKMQFNLETERGKTAFSDVKFFGDEQEWSIGYNVPVGGAKVLPQKGVREIETLDLYEYSPVLFGAMPLAATQSVKSAQTAFKAMGGAGKWTVPDWTADAVEEKAVEGGPIEQATNETDVESNLGGDDQIGLFEIDANGIVEADLDEYEEVEVSEVSGKAIFGPDDLDVAVKALDALNNLLGAVTGYKVHSQVPGDDVASEAPTEASGALADAVKQWLPDHTDLWTLAKALDAAVASGDDEQVESAASDFLDAIEEKMDEDGADTSALTKLAKLVATTIDGASGKEPVSGDTAQEKSGKPPVASWKDEDFDDDTIETVDISDLARLRAALDDSMS